MTFSLFHVANAEWSVGEFWDLDNIPKIKFSCDTIDTTCYQLCNVQTGCEVIEKVCRDCVGTSILMTNVFEGMGIQYRNTNENVSNHDFFDFLKLGMFVTFSSKSIYNQTDSYDSDYLRTKFLSLCPSGTQNVLAFFSLKNKSNSLDEARYVVCDDSVFGMSDDPEVVLNGFL
jgi:hypothetical protein